MAPRPEPLPSEFITTPSCIAKEFCLIFYLRLRVNTMAVVSNKSLVSADICYLEVTLVERIGDRIQRNSDEN